MALFLETVDEENRQVLEQLSSVPQTRVTVEPTELLINFFTIS